MKPADIQSICPSCNQPMNEATINGAPGYVCLACNKIVTADMKKQRTKYNNERTEWNSVVYDSKREARFAQELDLGVKASVIDWWCRQPSFVLPGGVIYRADFIFMDSEGVHVVDVKGHLTKEYLLKKRQIEALYRVKIEER